MRPRTALETARYSVKFLFVCLIFSTSAHAASSTPLATTVAPLMVAANVTTLLPAGSDVLYDQLNHKASEATRSQDFEAALDVLDAQAADDFIVPEAETWSITGVDVRGEYHFGAGPAASYNVYFYADAGGLPGTLLASRPLQSYTDAEAPAITIDPAVVLTQGSYWVSVQARLDANVAPGGRWGWEQRAVQAHHAAAWQNPGDGFQSGCLVWGPMQAVCVLTAKGPDLAFRLNGTSSGGFPTMALTPTALEMTQVVDTTQVMVLAIANTRTGRLEWTVDEAESSGCTTFGELPWASVSPDAGTNDHSSTSLVTVIFDSTGLAPGNYAGELCVASNDPAAPLLAVPVSLAVEESGPISPRATFAPTSLSFTVPANQSAAQTLKIANAAGSEELTVSSRSFGSSPAAVLRGYGTHGAGDAAVNVQSPSLRGGGSFGGLTATYPWTSSRPDGSLSFQLDDGSYENNASFGTDTHEYGAVWINRFEATGALVIDSISIMWPTNNENSLLGLVANLVAYYDADADGNPGNAVRLGTDNLVTIAALDVFEVYPANFFVPGAGDVYIGFVDQWALAAPYTPRLFPAALDETPPSQLKSYLSASSTTAPLDVDNLGNNNRTGEISVVGSEQQLAGNWLIRATGIAGGSAGPCSGPVVHWLSVSPESRSVNGGGHVNLIITANPSADSLAEGSYAADLCLTTNDPSQALVAIPVNLTVTAPSAEFCQGGTDTIFCDTFEPVAPPADVVTGAINLPVASGFSISLDFLTGTTAFALFREDDISLTSGGNGLHVYWYDVPIQGGVSIDGGLSYEVLHSGAVIGPGVPFSDRDTDLTVYWGDGADGYLGIRFLNENTGVMNYGYLHLISSAPNGFPAQVLDYGYNSAGNAITIP